MNLYYAIIGDALHTKRKTRKTRKTDNKYEWILIVFLFFSGFLMFNIFSLFVVIDIFTGYNIIIGIEQFLPGALSSKWGFIIFLYSSCMCIIYFSIFHKKKYRYIYRNYKHRKGKLYIAYFIVSGLLFIGTLLLRNYFKWGVVFKVATLL